MWLQRSAHRLPSVRPHIQTVAARRSWSSTPKLSSPEQPSKYREGMATYRSFAGPFSKVFLGAVLTYQVIYWTWMKLETDEEKLEKNTEVAALEKQARELAATKK
ncbi:hypothetical protein N7468_001982 [Penicillium chermesinum]|uniref:Uncharacterized protein n=1 Tax=Penicillium chermesinum TaxID=63820 RepID=A0A9W9TZ55_9EURO|nr:uncharacterized protein N7468_001982 [Penicillium chermesinum]KAJ5246999.1 hypothetical protein N7468_001982 [Penicillium chermesinum]KAJ6145250.1 hypothetical protein N7470_009145 [Penicillium chermesinum]